MISCTGSIVVKATAKDWELAGRELHGMHRTYSSCHLATVLLVLIFRYRGRLSLSAVNLRRCLLSDSH